MENKKKITSILSFVIFLLVGCSQNTCIHIRDGIYKDIDGEIYFRLLNKGVRHPKYDDDNEFMYRMYIYRKWINFNGKKINLRDVVDLKTIKEVHHSYYTDKNYIYVFPDGLEWVGSPSFFLLNNENANFIDKNSEYLKVNKTIYSSGIKINNINSESIEYFTTKALFVNYNNLKITYTFIGDKKNLFVSSTLLDLKRFCRYNIEEKIRTKILERYFIQEGSNSKACDKFPKPKKTIVKFDISAEPDDPPELTERLNNIFAGHPEKAVCKNKSRPFYKI